jgi:murein DD-endopeptidase MepM/ murein hydrolase activator NlpD
MAELRAAYLRMAAERDAATAHMREAYRDLLARSGAGDLGLILGQAQSERLAESEALLARNAALAQRISALQTELAERQGEQERLATSGQVLAKQRDFLASQLAEMQERNGALSQRVAALDRRLAEDQTRFGELGHTREAAGRKLAEAQDEVGDLRRQNEAAAAQIAALRAGLASLGAERDKMSEARAAVDRHVGELEQQLAALQADQRNLIARLNERAAMSSIEIERSIAMTGLDVDKLLKEASRESFAPRDSAAGRGGPFVAYRPPRPPAQGHGHSSEVERVVAALDSQEERREGLRRLLARLPLSAPLENYHLGSPFGRRIDPLNGRLAMHTGVDLTAEPGAHVYATAPGRVVFAGWDGTYGKMVEIDHGMGIHTRYAHLRTISVEVGRRVAAHSELGVIGSTGRSTGLHVHYEILVGDRPYDPVKFMRAGQYVFSKG